MCRSNGRYLGRIHRLPAGVLHQVGSGWLYHQSVFLMKYLNLYAGLGGNRAQLPEYVQVTAVENDPAIAGVYRGLYPLDTVIVGDAHQFLIDNFDQYDFIWSSPPCQTHSKMMKATRHKTRRYPDLALYQEILFLQHFCTTPWAIENVKPFYQPLTPPSFTIGRHMFWSSGVVHGVEAPAQPADFINLSNLEGMRKMQDWLGIHYDKPIYYKGNHCPVQVLRNCVHPVIGRKIFEALT